MNNNDIEHADALYASGPPVEGPRGLHHEAGAPDPAGPCYSGDRTQDRSLHADEQHDQRRLYSHVEASHDFKKLRHNKTGQ